MIPLKAHRGRGPLPTWNGGNVGLIGAAAPRTPEQWLEEIRRLKQQGREREAAEALAEFRKAYPGYALPEDLR